MPNIKSAIKRIKTDRARRLQNRSRKSALHTFEKNFLNKLKEKDFEVAEQLLKKIISLYDKSAKVGTVHKNLADRKKSRLSKLFQKNRTPSLVEK